HLGVRPSPRKIQAAAARQHGTVTTQDPPQAGTWNRTVGMRVGRDGGTSAWDGHHATSTTGGYVIQDGRSAGRAEPRGAAVGGRKQATPSRATPGVRGGRRGGGSRGG